MPLFMAASENNHVKTGEKTVKTPN